MGRPARAAATRPCLSKTYGEWPQAYTIVCMTVYRIALGTVTLDACERVLAAAVDKKLPRCAWPKSQDFSLKQKKAVKDVFPEHFNEGQKNKYIASFAKMTKARRSAHEVTQENMENLKMVHERIVALTEERMHTSADKFERQVDTARLWTRMAFLLCELEDAHDLSNFEPLGDDVTILKDEMWIFVLEIIACIEATCTPVADDKIATASKKTDQINANVKIAKRKAESPQPPSKRVCQKPETAAEKKTARVSTSRQNVSANVEQRDVGVITATLPAGITSAHAHDFELRHLELTLKMTAQQKQQTYTLREAFQTQQVNFTEIGRLYSDMSAQAKELQTRFQVHAQESEDTFTALNNLESSLQSLYNDHTQNMENGQRVEAGAALTAL